MIRQLPVLVIALCLSSVPVQAQGTHMTVSATSVEIRKGPSVANPVIGHARQGTVLEITRDVGDWYKVSWPDAADGVGYVRKNAARNATEGTAPASRATAASASGSSRIMPVTPGAAPLPAPVQPGPQTSYVATPTHAFGIGALAGGPIAASEIGVGMSARAWSRRRLGLQVEISRYTLTSTLGPGQVSAVHVAPSALYALTGRVSDFVWVRPYVGVGGHISRSTLNGITPGIRTSDSAFGMQTFGGGELTFASMPRVALSADAGYRWMRESFTGFDGSGLGVTVGAHWYIR